MNYKYPTSNARKLRCAVTLGVFACASNAAQATNYQFSWVGSGPISPYTSSENITQLNNTGQILGYRLDASIIDTGIGYQRTSGLFNGTTFSPFAGLSGASSISALNMNDTGHATGLVYLSAEDIRPARWDDTSTITELSRLNGYYAEGADINNAGQIAGSSWADTNFHAVRWDVDNSIHDLGSLGGSFSRGTGINDQGYVVGISYTGNDDAAHATLWTPNGTAIDLDTSGSGYSWAEKINNHGQIVGFTTNENGLWDTTLWNVDGSAPIDLTASLAADVDTFFDQGHSTSINEAGQVVFDAFNADGSQAAYLWSNGNLTDIGTLLPAGVLVNTVTGINDNGVIYGRASINGNWGGFVLAPAAVPIPGAAWLFGSVLAGFAGVKRRKRSPTD
ncbi:hypothetical protein [Methylomonas sp. UP202]|uniref:hypothetical protein n=1 Tax=Methylomonas sp. UP202 TaxID=3040943 RepID=UPI002479D521|nr:hypothetical protein [Methylomonas sp. UP202]WGS85764.1 hypothetical protein QC632_22440 [Methylomonas sp. UP202]